MNKVSASDSPATRSYRFADLRLDPGRRELSRDGKPIDVGRLTYGLLLELVQSAPNVVTHEELVQRVWHGRLTSPETVTQRVKLLRDALGDVAEQPCYIGLVRGHGYRLIPPVEVLAAPEPQPAERKDDGQRDFVGAAGPLAPVQGVARSNGRWHGQRNVGAALLLILVASIAIAFARGFVEDETAPKLAILPCENLSPDADDRYFALGLHAEILYRTSKLSGLRVISRTSLMEFADPDTRPPVSVIAERLGARYVMECSLRYSNDQILVDAQLIDAETDLPLFSEHYLASLHDLNTVFATQADLALRIARELGAGYTPAEQARVERVPTESMGAYALYLRAIELADSRARIALLEEALRLDGNFALAHGELALAFAYSLVNSGQGSVFPAGQRGEVITLLQDHARQAISLDGDAAEAYTALGVLGMVTWRWTEAETALARAVELAPRAAPSAWMHYGQLLAGFGRYGEAIALSAKARELDPGDPNACAYAFQLGFAGLYDEAAAVLDRAIVAAPTEVLYRHWQAYMQIALGHPDVALRHLEIAEQLAADRRPTGYLGPWAYAYSRAGSREDAVRIFREIEQAAAAGAPPGAGGWAMAYLAIDDQARALESLEVAAARSASHEIDEGIANLLALKSNVTNDPVLRRPEFVAALSRVRGD